MHGSLLPENERLDQCCNHHRVRDNRLPKPFGTTERTRLTFSQIPHLCRGQIPTSRRSFHHLLQRRSSPTDPRRRGTALRTDAGKANPAEIRKPAALPLEQLRRGLPHRDRRLGRQSPHAAALGQIGERIR